MAEEFALQQGLGHGRTVHGNEWARCSLRFVMEQPAEPLFSHPALASQKDAGIDAGKSPRQVERALHRIARSDDAGRIDRALGGTVKGPDVLLQLSLRALQR